MPESEKIIAEKPEKGEIEIELEKLPDAHARGIYRAQECEKEANKMSKVFSGKTKADEEYSLEILSMEQVGICFSLLVRVEKNGEEIPINNPIRIFNPPTKVPNGTFREEEVNGETVLVPNYEENPQAAIQEVLSQAISPQIERFLKVKAEKEAVPEPLPEPIIEENGDQI